MSTPPFQIVRETGNWRMVASVEQHAKLSEKQSNKSYFLLDARKDLTTDSLKRLTLVVRFSFADPTAENNPLSPESFATFPIPTMY